MAYPKVKGAVGRKDGRPLAPFVMLDTEGSWQWLTPKAARAFAVKVDRAADAAELDYASRGLSPRRSGVEDGAETPEQGWRSALLDLVHRAHCPFCTLPIHAITIDSGRGVCWSCPHDCRSVFEERSTAPRWCDPDATTARLWGIYRRRSSGDGVGPLLALWRGTEAALLEWLPAGYVWSIEARG